MFNLLAGSKKFRIEDLLPKRLVRNSRHSLLYLCLYGHVPGSFLLSQAVFPKAFHDFSVRGIGIYIINRDSELSIVTD